MFVVTYSNQNNEGFGFVGVDGSPRHILLQYLQANEPADGFFSAAIYSTETAFRQMHRPLYTWLSARAALRKDVQGHEYFSTSDQGGYEE